MQKSKLATTSLQNPGVASARFDWLNWPVHHFIHAPDLNKGAWLLCFMLLKVLNMASQSIDGVNTMENASAISSHPGFSSEKYSLLVVVGEHTAAGSVEYLVSEIERGKVCVFS